MTTWAISVADTFFNELLNLPQAIQKKVSKVVKTLEADPISAQGDAKKLKGYTNNVYRVRLGDYRLFYSFGQGLITYAQSQATFKTWSRFFQVGFSHFIFADQRSKLLYLHGRILVG